MKVCKLLHARRLFAHDHSAWGLSRSPDCRRPQIWGVRLKLEVNCWRTRRRPIKRPWLKAKNALKIVVGVLALVIVWIGFQLGTHRHTGILRALVEAKHFLADASASFEAQQRSASGPPEPQHNVNLSWKASTAAVIGYNVYRRGAAGLVKLNSVPVTGTSYVDTTAQPGQTYYYVTKAVNVKGTESAPSNEVRADIPRQ